MIRRADARRGGGTAHVFDDEVAIGLGLLLFLRCERTYGEAQLALLVTVVSIVERGFHLVLIEERNLYRDLLLFAAAPDIKLGLGARLDARDDRGQLGERSIMWPLTPTTTSPGLRPAFSPGCRSARSSRARRAAGQVRRTPPAVR